MSKNKRYDCKYKPFGCGGSCFGLNRMHAHEETCRYAPAGQGLSEAFAARIAALETAVTHLVKHRVAQAKAHKKQGIRIHSLEVQVMQLQATVARIVPDYTHIELTHMNLARYMTEKCESWSWAEALIARCKYGNPKHMFTQFMQLLLEKEPYFFKLKTYDMLTVDVDFGDGTTKGDMPIRDFVIKFHECCLVLMKDLWPNVEEINKVPHLPRIMCTGYTESNLKRLERANKFVRAQYARQHRLQLHQDFVNRIDSAVELFRDGFREKLKNARVLTI